MDEAQAETLASAFGGEAWQSGGDIWLVVIRRNDSSLVVFSEEAICEYDDDDAFEVGKARTIIYLATVGSRSE